MFGTNILRNTKVSEGNWWRSQGKGDKPVILGVHFVMPDVPSDGIFHPDEFSPIVGRALEAEVETRTRGLECPPYVCPL